MATNFPTDLDNLSNPAATDELTGHAELHTNINDAIEAIQTKVGIDGSADTSSLDYRVTLLEETPPSTDATRIYENVLNETGSTIAAGKAVYVSGAVGASGKLRISLASNNSEPTSSKTFGITRDDIVNGQEGVVITEGLLQNINTNGATSGDPVWLGINGAMLFGIANKPSAPSHLVFLGIVIRAHSTTGSIFVKIQNGFELNELHDVAISNVENGQVLRYNSSSGLWENLGLDEFATTDYVDSSVATISNNTDTITTLLGLEGNNDLTITGIENKTTVDSFNSADYHTVKYELQITRGSQIYSSSLLVLCDGVNVGVSESNIISNTEASLANVTFEENSGIIGLCVTPTSTAVTVRYFRTALKA